MSKDFYSDAEEFEFKPLTQGLGFQKQASEAAPERVAPVSHQPQAQSARPAMQTLQTPSPSFPMNESTLSETLPRQPARNYRSESVNYSTNNSNKKIEEILTTLKNRPRLEIVEKPENLFERTSFELAAGLLDGLLIVALNLVALIGMIYSTRIDLFFNLRNPADGSMIYAALAGMFLFFTWSYLIATRIFMGQTAGEWVFEQRLGEPSDMGRWNYFGKVIARSTIILVSGIVTFPILSMFMKKDILGHLLRLELLRSK